MLTEADVRAALGKVIHPTYGMSLVTLQMVCEIRLSPERIEIDLVMNCPGCPAGQAVLARAQQVLESLPSADGAQVAMCLLAQIWQPPWQSLADMF
ncbi:MAG: iron-sulfur cluster assembly protein [Anaerolineae bacterium]|nr:iron-sulfur cluster assembly protein [Anaerolineae bacterium]